GGAAQLVDRRQVYARIRIDQVLAVRGILDRVVAVPLGQRDQTGAVEVDAVVVDQVRVLVRVHAAGAKPDLPLLLVNAVDAADDPFAFGDLVLDDAGFGIDQVKLTPTVALGGVDDFLGFLQPVHGLQVHVFRVGGPDERLGLLV